MNITFNSNHHPDAEPRSASLRAEARTLRGADGVSIIADFTRVGSGSAIERFYTNLDATDARNIADVLSSAADEYDRLVEKHNKVRLTVEVPAAKADEFKEDIALTFGGKVIE